MSNYYLMSMNGFKRDFLHRHNYHKFMIKPQDLEIRPDTISDISNFTNMHLLQAIYSNSLFSLMIS